MTIPVIVYEVMIDFDATDWTATPTFAGTDDITDYVKEVYWERGKDQESGNHIAGTLNIEIDNSSKNFSPPYAAGDYYGKWRPWLPVRVRATIDGGANITIYTGFISRLKVNPSLDSPVATLYCTDGMDLLARNMVTQNEDDRTLMNDGEAVGRVLDAAGWSKDKRTIDSSGSEIVKYPTTVAF